jgi:hypothetical protein
MTFFLAYWKQLVIAGSLVLLFSVGYYKGYSAEKAKFDAFKAELALRAKVQEEKNNDTIKRQKQITANIKKDYADALKKLSIYYDVASSTKWLRDHGSVSGKLPDVSSTASGTNGDTQSNQSGATGVDALDCASDVLQLLNLQKWIKDQTIVNN